MLNIFFSIYYYHSIIIALLIIIILQSEINVILFLYHWVYSYHLDYRTGFLCSCVFVICHQMYPPPTRSQEKLSP